jgi:hypothetical protein
MKQRILWAIGGAVAALVVTLALGAAGPPTGDLPPHLTAGKTFYGIVFAQPDASPLGPLSATTPIKVLGSEGSWYLLEVPRQPRGPVWVNMDLVVSYRTDL